MMPAVSLIAGDVKEFRETAERPVASWYGCCETGCW
jgi:hypothetical protein